MRIDVIQNQGPMVPQRRRGGPGPDTTPQTGQGQAAHDDVPSRAFLGVGLDDNGPRKPVEVLFQATTACLILEASIARWVHRRCLQVQRPSLGWDRLHRIRGAAMFSQGFWSCVWDVESITPSSKSRFLGFVRPASKRAEGRGPRGGRLSQAPSPQSSDVTAGRAAVTASSPICSATDRRKNTWRFGCLDSVETTCGRCVRSVRCWSLFLMMWSDPARLVRGRHHMHYCACQGRSHPHARMRMMVEARPSRRAFLPSFAREKGKLGGGTQQEKAGGLNFIWTADRPRLTWRRPAAGGCGGQ